MISADQRAAKDWSEVPSGITRSKREQSELIERQTQEYLAAGKQIHEIPSGLGDDVLKQHLELISQQEVVRELGITNRQLSGAMLSGSLDGVPFPRWKREGYNWQKWWDADAIRTFKRQWWMAKQKGGAAA